MFLKSLTHEKCETVACVFNHHYSDTPKENAMQPSCLKSILISQYACHSILVDCFRIDVKIHFYRLLIA